MSRIKNELVLSLMREKIKKEIIEYDYDRNIGIIDDVILLNSLMDRIMIHIESAAKQID